ncbi:MAG TPA: GNAT family N-acetyltransferase [Anaerolineae bacterium]
MATNGISAFQRGVIWAIDLAGQNLPAPIEPRVEARFKEIGPELAGALAQAMGRSAAESVQQRLAGNRCAFALSVEGELASYCWISQGVEQVGEMERTIRLPAGEAYIWDCATLPAYRRQGLYTALLCLMVQRLAAEGLQRIWIGANLDNLPSLRAFARAGFRPVLTLTYGRLLGLHISLAAADSEAPGELVAAARQLFSIEGEWSSGPLSVGWRQFEWACDQNGKRR